MFTPGSITQSLEEWKSRYQQANLKASLASNEVEELRHAVRFATIEIDNLKRQLKEATDQVALSSECKCSCTGKDIKKKRHESGRTSSATTDSTSL